MRRALLGVMAVFLECTVWAVQIDVVITVDNAYGFGFGDANSITTYFGGIRNVTAGEIFTGPPVLFTGPSLPPYTNPGVGPELYQLAVPSVLDYVYLLAWSDKSSYQGALAGFQLPNGPLLSGTGTWQVFATGINRNSYTEGDTLTAADLPLINAQIALANANGGGAGTSIGWVDEFGMLPNNTPGVGALALGDYNDFPGFQGVNSWIVQGISSNSRWMWYNKDPNTFSNPFAYSGEGPGGHNEFLIFRTQIAHVLESAIPEPATATVVVAGLALAALRRRRATPNRRAG